MKKILSLGLMSILLCFGGVGIAQSRNALTMSTDVNALSVYAVGDDSSLDATEPTTRGLYTALSLSINGGNSRVWATVKNDFTLFPATVIVVVELYSSNTYYEDYRQMTLISRNTTPDLDMGDTIRAEASTGGVQKYWQARMRYKVDNNAWAEKVTDSLLYDGNGNT